MSSKPSPEFSTLLAEVMAGYGKPLPDAVIVRSWWSMLSPFPVHVVRAAFHAYSLEKPDYAPVPNSIAARCRLLDGRPGAEEAYALALTTLDEQITVVWTQECAEAFAKARPVLDASGAISARKTFVEIYDRLVVAAREQGVPVKWFTSPGLDKIGYDAAVKRATATGQLPAPAPTLQLSAPAAPETFSIDPRAQLEHIKQAMLDGIAAKQRAADAEIDARNEAKDQAENEITAGIQRKVDEYRAGGAA